MFQAETHLRDCTSVSKVLDGSEVSCLTCFMPSQDLPCPTGKPSQNLFASVGLSDARLGMKHAAWRANAASERGRSEGELVCASLGDGDAPDTLRSELERLLNDDLDHVHEAPAALAPVIVRNNPSNKYDDILPYFDASRDDTDTDMVRNMDARCGLRWRSEPWFGPMAGVCLGRRRLGLVWCQLMSLCLTVCSVVRGSPVCPDFHDCFCADEVIFSHIAVDW